MQVAFLARSSPRAPARASVRGIFGVVCVTRRASAEFLRVPGENSERLARALYVARPTASESSTRARDLSSGPSSFSIPRCISAPVPEQVDEAATGCRRRERRSRSRACGRGCTSKRHGVWISLWNRRALLGGSLGLARVVLVVIEDRVWLRVIVLGSREGMTMPPRTVTRRLWLVAIDGPVDTRCACHVPNAAHDPASPHHLPRAELESPPP